MQAIMLAGGLGTRLRSVISDRPKPMALIGEKPFLHYIVDELKKNDIDDIVMAVGYKGEMVESYFENGEKFGVHIRYSYEKEQLGTAGAIKNAEEFISEDNFFVLNADTFYKINYAQMIEIQKNVDADMTLVVRKVEDISRYGQAKVEENKLVSFNEKIQKAIPGTINGGVYLINKKLINNIPRGKVSLENDIIPSLLAKHKVLGALVSEGYFIDIGIPSDYYQFIEDVKGGKYNDY